MIERNGGLMDDLISRQEAIDAVENIDCSDGVGISALKCEAVDDGVTAIKALPSAQPETHEERTETHACEDAVSREAVSEWLKQYGQDVLHGKYKFSLMYIWKNLMDLPSAQPELPEWAQKVEEYRKSAPSFVRNQLVWALYQTWKEYDGQLVHQRGKENR